MGLLMLVGSLAVFITFLVLWCEIEKARYLFGLFGLIFTLIIPFVYIANYTPDVNEYKYQAEVTMPTDQKGYHTTIYFNDFKQDGSKIQIDDFVTKYPHWGDFGLINKSSRATIITLSDNGLEIPDTWEVNLSSGKDKKETFTRLIKENKLGALALLRNLRNMSESGVDEKLVFNALDAMKTDKVLPFRFISAARAVPNWEDKIEPVMLKCLANHEKMQGKTILLVDISGSMDSKLSDKSDITRMDTACALAVLLREISDCEVYSFSDKIVQIPARHGFALRDAIVNSQSHSSTYLGKAVSHVCDRPHDRLIVITDEQSHDEVGNPKAKGYMINVASNENGVGYGAWTHIDGFSEAVIDYILEFEKLNENLEK